MADFSIRDLSQFSGLKQHTIRVWEQRYTFLRPMRKSSSHRTYNAEELDILLKVTLLNRSGHKISHIDKMTLDAKREEASKVNNQQQRAIHDLIIQMARMDVNNFDLVLNNCISAWGIHTAIQNVLIPFLNRVGLLEKEYNKNYLENILIIRQSIKQKLHLGIEKAGSESFNNKSALLFFSNADKQELTLLYFHYLLKLQGFEVLSLGQLCVEHLQLICSRLKPDFIITSLVSKSVQKELAGFSEQLTKISSRSEFIVINKLPASEGKAVSYSIEVKDFEEALEVMNKADI